MNKKTLMQALVRIDAEQNTHEKLGMIKSLLDQLSEKILWEYFDNGHLSLPNLTDLEHKYQWHSSYYVWGYLFKELICNEPFIQSLHLKDGGAKSYELCLELFAQKTLVGQEGREGITNVALLSELLNSYHYHPEDIPMSEVWENVPYSSRVLQDIESWCRFVAARPHARDLLADAILERKIEDEQSPFIKELLTKFYQGIARF